MNLLSCRRVQAGRLEWKLRLGKRGGLREGLHGRVVCDYGTPAPPTYRSGVDGVAAAAAASAENVAQGAAKGGLVILFRLSSDSQPPSL